MEAPFSIHIEVKDSAGKLVQEFANHELTYEALVSMQEAIAAALVGLGKAGVALKKGPTR